ncbi:MAG: hypothetical protein AAB225_15695 [Acidobacteriota bacterium]
MILLAALVLALPLAAADPARDTRWREDLQYLAGQLPQRHPNLFFQMKRENFDAAVSDLERRIPELTDAEVTVSMMRIVAAAGDGHTAVFPLPSWRRLPVALRWFQDGLFVIAAAPEHSRALGARVVQIGSYQTTRAYEAMSAVISHENDAWLRQQSASYLTIPEVLFALRITPDAEQARFVLEDTGGARFTLDLTPSSVSLRQAPDPAIGFVPYWRRNTSRNYWFEILEGSRTLYLAYNQCQNMPGLPFAAFAQEVFAAAEPAGVERLVIDVRNNTGGDSSVIEPLLQGIEQGIRNTGMNPEGRLFVIIGRQTASSAMMNAITLKDRLGALLVGEPTGGRPNHYGQVQSFELPHSRLRVQHSTRYFRLRPDDTPSLIPDIARQVASTDYLARHDPFLAAVLAYPDLAPKTEAAPGALVVVNAAGFRGPVAPGSLASIFGDFDGITPGDATSVPLPGQIAGVRLLVNEASAPLVAVRSGQINFQVPAATAPGRAAIRVTASGRELAAGAAEVAAAGPGLFVLDPASLDRRGAILNQDSQINSESARARRGEVIQIFATGGGAVTPAIEDGAAGLARTLAWPRVFIGLEEAPVVFSGVSSQFPGLWQINVRVPERSSLVGQAPAFLHIGGRSSNAVTVWVAE